MGVLQALLILYVLSYTHSSRIRYPFKSSKNSVCANHAMGEFVSNLQDCKKFYLCNQNGEAVPARCPLNMFFNPASQICDTQANVRCEESTLALTASTTQPSTVIDYCLNAFAQQPNSDSLIFLAHPSNCNQYYMCYYGQALLQQCSIDLQWNARIAKCDLPTNVKCREEGVKISVQIAPTEAAAVSGNGIVCPIYGQHIFPHMQRCDFFIFCVKGHAILQQCPFYKYFDVESSRCRRRKMALCIKDLKLEFRKNTLKI